LARPSPPFFTPAVAEQVQLTLGQLIARHGEGPLERVLQALAIITGEAEEPQLDPRQRPGMLYIPGLPHQPWYEASEYPETREVARVLREAWPRMREEFLAHATARERFEPYAPPEEVERYHVSGLRGPEEWTGLFFSRNGIRYEESYRDLKETARVLAQLEPSLLVQHESFFSVLSPGAALRPHCDATNAKLSVHLGVLIPERCGIKVGGIAKRWVEGETYLFDETWEHEAWNHDQTPRVCFLTDIWHPELTPVERAALRELIEVALRPAPPQAT
jgi:aspartyl/asparaginyl beta-hydroxylase (cupin superfamily)